MKQTFNKIKKVAYLEDTNCCTVIASAVAFDKPFKEVQKYFFSIGRKRNKGFDIYSNMDKICNKYGFKYERIAGHSYRNNLIKKIFGKTLTANNVANYLDLSTYFIGTNSHIFTLKNGVVEDWSRNRKFHVECIIRLEPIKKVKDLTFKKVKYDFSEF